MKKINKDKLFKSIISIGIIGVMSLILLISPIFNVKHATASTKVKEWTFSDNALHLSYDAVEYQDDTFVIKEFYFNSLSRTITGHAYIDTVNGKKEDRAAVDSSTLNYWSNVINSYQKKEFRDSIKAAIDFLNFYFTPWGSLSYIEYIRLSATAATNAYSFINDNNGLATDVDKTIYEMACASDCAWDLAHNPRVIVPSIKKPIK